MFEVMGHLSERYKIIKQCQKKPQGNKYSIKNENIK